MNGGWGTVILKSSMERFSFTKIKLNFLKSSQCITKLWYAFYLYVNFWFGENNFFYLFKKLQIKHSTGGKQFCEISYFLKFN